MNLPRLYRNSLLALTLSGFLFTAAPTLFSAPDSPATQARAAALETAGAFSNDGFKIRDGHWIETIAPNQPKLIQVNLFAGNQYWFIAAASDGAKQLQIALFDERGNPICTEPYQNKAHSAAGFSPQVSGPYYVRIEETEGTPATFCLLYSYK